MGVEVSQMSRAGNNLARGRLRRRFAVLDPSATEFQRCFLSSALFASGKTAKEGGGGVGGIGALHFRLSRKQVQTKVNI